MGVLLAVLLAGCGRSGASPSAPTQPTTAPASEVAIAVDASRTRQTIEDVGGGNFIHTFARVTTGLDPIGRFNFEGIGPRQVRLRMALEDWEPENDDGDPGRAAAGRFRDEGYNHGAFLLAQEAAARGIELVASIWDAPGWMVANSGSERSRKIPPELYSELAESMGEWLRSSGRCSTSCRRAPSSSRRPRTGAHCTRWPRARGATSCCISLTAAPRTSRWP